MGKEFDAPTGTDDSCEQSKNNNSNFNSSRIKYANSQNIKAFTFEIQKQVTYN